MAKTYIPKINVLETQTAIESIKNTFQLLLCKELNMVRVSAPIILDSNINLNDNLASNSDPVRFKPKNLNKNVEIVQSLAKWKRMALKKYGFKTHTGIFTDMNAIRPDDDIDYCHSLYVDQWDWEYIIEKEEINIDFLKEFIRKFYKVLLITEKFINAMYKQLNSKLPNDLYIITAKDLYKMYPNLEPGEREKQIVKEHKAVFIIGIGAELGDGVPPHDIRALDYDNIELNGDLIVYNEIHDHALELMSMGIRVDKDSLIKQKKIDITNKNALCDYYQMILDNELPFTIGGGLGQSRFCMFLLEKMHIGEVQVSVWDDEEVEKLKENNINLL